MVDAATRLAERALPGALRGERGAMEELVRALSPVIQARVVRVLRRNGRAVARNLRQEVQDMTQEVLLCLFDDGARILRKWDPERGFSLPNYVGLIAERTAVNIMSSGKRNPWTEDPTLDEQLDRQGEPPGIEAGLASRELLGALLDRLRVALGPEGVMLFELMFVEERPADEVATALRISRDALYARISRLRKVVTRLWTELQQARTASSSAM